MSVSIGQRVQSMIEHMSKGEVELALSDICIAIDITSQKYYNEPNSSASCYKRFRLGEEEILRGRRTRRVPFALG